jgi:hypothetical protein
MRICDLVHRRCCFLCQLNPASCRAIATVLMTLYAAPGTIWQFAAEQREYPSDVVALVMLWRLHHKLSFARRRAAKRESRATCSAASMAELMFSTARHRPVALRCDIYQPRSSVGPQISRATAPIHLGRLPAQHPVGACAYSAFRLRNMEESCPRRGGNGGSSWTSSIAAVAHDLFVAWTSAIVRDGGYGSVQCPSCGRHSQQ